MVSRPVQAERLGGPWFRRVPGTELGSFLVLVAMLLAVLHRDGEGFAYPGTPLLIFTIAGWLPLLGRTRWPLLVLAATTLISAAQLVLIPVLDPAWMTPVAIAAYQPVPIAVAVAAYTVAARGSRNVERFAGLAPALLLPLTGWVAQGGNDPWTALVMCSLVINGTVVGALVAARRERLARDVREQEERTRREVEAERLRIARELHDVLAHHLTLVNAQAAVADYLLRTDAEAAAKALEGMSKHTRQALDELRTTVGLLREGPTELGGPSDRGSASEDAPDRSPLPTLDRLPQLLKTVRAAGATIDLHTQGDPRPLSPGVDLAAYRIVQEALTNAAKHAAGAPVTLKLDWRDDHLDITVANPVTSVVRPNGTSVSSTASAAASASPGGGHGLIGMAERVRAAAGTLTITPPERGTKDLPGGRFTIAASLPIDLEGPLNQ